MKEATSKRFEQIKPVIGCLTLFGVLMYLRYMEYSGMITMEGLEDYENYVTFGALLFAYLMLMVWVITYAYRLLDEIKKRRIKG